jgi:hypothetical protein
MVLSHLELEEFHLMVLSHLELEEFHLMVLSHLELEELPVLLDRDHRLLLLCQMHILS